MATLIKCASCGKKIKANAVTCPKCQIPIASAVKSVHKTPADIATKKAERKGAIWAYITGTLFIITGLGAFQISLLSALMLIFGGILALPFVRAGLVKLSGFSTDKFLIVASAVLIISGVIGYTSSVKNDRLDSMASDTAISD